MYPGIPIAACITVYSSMLHVFRYCGSLLLHSDSPAAALARQARQKHDRERYGRHGGNSSPAAGIRPEPLSGSINPVLSPSASATRRDDAQGTLEEFSGGLTAKDHLIKPKEGGEAGEWGDRGNDTLLRTSEARSPHHHRRRHRSGLAVSLDEDGLAASDRLSFRSIAPAVSEPSRNCRRRRQVISGKKHPGREAGIAPFMGSEALAVAALGVATSGAPSADSPGTPSSPPAGPKTPPLIHRGHYWRPMMPSPQSGSMVEADEGVGGDNIAGQDRMGLRETTGFGGPKLLGMSSPRLATFGLALLGLAMMLLIHITEALTRS